MIAALASTFLSALMWIGLGAGVGVMVLILAILHAHEQAGREIDADRGPP